MNMSCYVLNRTLNENIEFLKRMAIEMFRLCFKIMFTSDELEWWHQHNAMRKYMQLPRFFFNFGQPFVWRSYSPIKHLFALFCQDFAPHSCWQYWWNGLKPKITVGPAVYIVGPTKFIRRQSRSKKAEASKAPATKIVCCKFNHYYQVMLLNCSCKFLIIKDTPGMVESDINPKRMALRFYLLTTDSNITIDILSLFQTTLPHLERQALISSQAK